MIKRFRRIFFLLFLFGLVACSTSMDRNGVENDILLWYDWPVADSAVLNTLIDEFSTLNPNVNVITVNFNVDEAEALDISTRFGRATDEPLLPRFKERAALGLGPDLLIGSSDWVRELADAGLIQELDQEVDDTSIYLSSAIETLRYRPPGASERALYGLPLALDLQALFYNKTMVTEPAESLEALLLQAQAGKKVALDINFEPAFWGVRAFGGQLFDEDGRMVLDQGGFANWLNWLQNAQDQPNIILDSDTETLAALFESGEVAYLVGSQDMLPHFQEALGPDDIGVAPLPRGPVQASGPFLRTEALMINIHSASAQTDLALQLARFLANTAQQTDLMRQTERIPANPQVRVNPEVYPAIAAFMAQARTAVPLPNSPRIDAILQLGDETYLQTLTGVLDPNEAATEFTNRINEMAGFQPVRAEAERSCPFFGELEVWHHWVENPEAAALQEIVDKFSIRCPGVTVNLTGFETETLLEQYQTLGGTAEGPDLVIGSSRWTASWAEDQLIANLSGVVDTDLTQQFLPTSLAAMSYNRALYGLPLSINLMALYYRPDIVTDPPNLINDLVNQVTAEQQIALPLTFYHTSWAARAFGSVTYDEDFNPNLDPDGMIAWLEWLEQAEQNPGVVLSRDPDELKNLFAEGEAIYYPGDALQLTELQGALGVEQLGVFSLPDGPVAEARPQLTAEGVMFNAILAEDESQGEMALEFAIHLTNSNSQTLLMEQANRVPSHINVDTSGHPAIAAFRDQETTAFALAQTPRLSQLEQAVNELYAGVIFGDEQIDEAVDTLLEQMEETGD